MIIYADQSSELGQALKRSQLELADALTECQHLKVQCRSQQVQLEDANAAAEVSSILNQELEEKEARMAQLSQESTYVLHFVCLHMNCVNSLE